MPRIDPWQLLKCLSVLLSPEGGIKTHQEVPRLVSLMTKFSKKLVSKCIYVQILKASKLDLLDQFMGSGGWALVHAWMTDALAYQNWALTMELLELLRDCPVGVDRLKENGLPKDIRALSKECPDPKVKSAAALVVSKWMQAVREEEGGSSTSQAESAAKDAEDDGAEEQEEEKVESSPSPTESHPDSGESSMAMEADGAAAAEPVDEAAGGQKPLGEKRQTRSQKLTAESVAEQLDKEEAREGSEEEEDDDDESGSSTVPVFKITIRDGKHLLSKLDKTVSKRKLPPLEKPQARRKAIMVEPRPEKDMIGDVKEREKKGKGAASKRAADEAKEETKRVKKEKEKEKEKERERKGQEKKDRETLQKLKLLNEPAEKPGRISGLPSISKLGKIPKKPRPPETNPSTSSAPASSGSSTSSNSSSSSSSSLLDKPRPKTVKMFNSKFRSVGLEEEIKPPPPPSTRSNKAALDKRLSKPSHNLKRGTSKAQSPPHTPTFKEQPAGSSSPSAEKKEKDKKVASSPPQSDSSSSPTQNHHGESGRRSSVTSRSSKSKQGHQIQESNMFMDALLAGSYEPRKRKRRNSTSTGKEVPEPKKEAGVKVEKEEAKGGGSSPLSSPTSTKPTLKFYQDTLETKEEEEDSDVKMEDEGSRTPPHEDVLEDMEAEDESEKGVKEEEEEEEEEDSNKEEDEAEDDDEDEAKKSKSKVEKTKSKASLPPAKGGLKKPLKSVLVVLRSVTANRTKKTVHWKAESKLKEVHYFELDETERANVTKSFLDMKQNEHMLERQTLLMARKIVPDDSMEEKISWRVPMELELPAALVAPASLSKEKEVQSAREKGILQAIYFSRDMIPPSPGEPPLEALLQQAPGAPPSTEQAKSIPLEDTTGNPENVNDFRNTPWPDPKSSQIPPVSPSQGTVGSAASSVPLASGNGAAPGMAGAAMPQAVGAVGSQQYQYPAQQQYQGGYQMQQMGGMGPYQGAPMGYPPPGGSMEGPPPQMGAGAAAGGWRAGDGTVYPDMSSQSMGGYRGGPGSAPPPGAYGAGGNGEDMSGAGSGEYVAPPYMGPPGMGPPGYGPGMGPPGMVPPPHMGAPMGMEGGWGGGPPPPGDYHHGYMGGPRGGMMQYGPPRGGPMGHRMPHPYRGGPHRGGRGRYQQGNHQGSRGGSGGDGGSGQGGSRGGPSSSGAGWNSNRAGEMRFLILMLLLCRMVWSLVRLGGLTVDWRPIVGTSICM